MFVKSCVCVFLSEWYFVRRVYYEATCFFRLFLVETDAVLKFKTDGNSAKWGI